MMRFTTPDGGSLVDAAGRGAALWRAPGEASLRPVDILRRASALPGVVGWRRLPTRLRGLLRLTHGSSPEGHAHLLMLGVRPVHQGRGVGGRLLRAGLARTDREAVGTVLYTANRRSIPFYRTHGYEVRDEPLVLPDGPEVWQLRRPPAPPVSQGPEAPRTR
jgi:ribosomal protein S18 acetylase RimI-like enzyme